MTESMQPIFIFSLPKAGSTLLQRMLGASPLVCTTAEPWILLPHIYALKANGVVSEYWHGHAVDAIEDFYKGFPHGKADYREALQNFVLTLYQKRAPGNCRYFLDKSPRYHLICDEIIRTFPKAKFIFLWRNPLAVASSIIQRWCNGRWKINLYNVDLYKGIEHLVKIYSSAEANVYGIRYEDLVRNPYIELQKICDYLELPYTDSMVESFYETPLNGRMAEHTGSRIYKNSISTASLDTWKKTFFNPFRKRWAKQYLDNIGRSRLEIMGYDLDQIKNDLPETRPWDNLISDILLSGYMHIKIGLSPMLAHSGKSRIMHYM